MGWELRPPEHPDVTVRFTDYGDIFNIVTLNPYSSSPNGLAQFAAILLKFPEVMKKFTMQGDFGETSLTWYSCGENKPSQGKILDAILLMKGIV